MALKNARRQFSEWSDNVDLEDLLVGVFIVALAISLFFVGPGTCSLSVDSHPNPTPGTATTTMRHG